MPTQTREQKYNEASNRVNFYGLNSNPSSMRHSNSEYQPAFDLALSLGAQNLIQASGYYNVDTPNNFADTPNIGYGTNQSGYAQRNAGTAFGSLASMGRKIDLNQIIQKKKHQKPHFISKLFKI